MAYEDLLKDTSESKDDGNYFLVTITDLDLGTAYPLQFRWKNKNGTLGAWSSVKTFVSESATIPSEPNLGSGDVVGGAGFIKVTWDGNNALSTAASNFDRVNVHISGTTFGDGTKPAGFFKQAGTQTFAAVAGEYIVQLKILTVNGSESLYSTARTVTVTSAVQSAASSVTPSTPTVSSVLGAIQLSWNGKTSTGADQPFGFNAAKVYVGTSAGFTPSSSNQVDVLNFANGQNTLNIGVGTIVDSVALTYGVDYYIKIATTNGTDTSTAVSATGNPVRVGQVTTGDIVTINADKIATGTLSSGSTITVGSTSGKHIKLSGTGDPFIIYGTGGVSNPILSYNGDKLTVVGDGTFSGALSAATGTFAGSLSAATGSFSGTITASGGTIGGITIAADGIQNSGGTFKIDSSGVIRAGSSSSNAVIISPTLGIYHSANGGSTASGRFTLGLASSTISGWTIGTSTLSSGNLTLNSNGTITTTNLTIYDTGRIVNAGGFEVTAAGKLIATGAEISGTITASALDTTALDIAATGAITTTSGNFGVTSGGILSATGANISGSLTTNGTAGGYANNTLTISGGKLSADKVIYLQTDISTGVVDVLGSIIYLEAPTEITGSVRASASATFGVTGSLFEFLSSSGNVRVAQTYNNSVSGRAMQISSAGMYGTTASTRRKKHEIESYRINSEALLNLDVKAFKYKPEIDQGQQQQHGFIAEDAQELGLNELIQYDSNGIPDYFAYEKLPIFLLQLIQEQDASINAMQARLDALEG
jgi:hypothetical protein